jgi:chromosome segregation ATPase
VGRYVFKLYCGLTLAFDAHFFKISLFVHDSDRVAELDSTIQSLEIQLQEQESEANTAITEWQNRSSELEIKLSRFEEELRSSKEELSSRDATIEKLQGLDDELASEQETWREDVDKVKIELADEKGRHQEARDEISALTMSLNEMKNESDDVVNIWTGAYFICLKSPPFCYCVLISVHFISPTGRVANLNSTIENLKSQSEEQETEADRAITEWQNKSSELEARVLGLQQELNVVKEASATKDSALEELQAEVIMHKKEIEAIKESNETDTTKTELAASRAENKLLNDKLAAEEGARRVEAQKFQSELASEKMRHQEARDEIEAFTNSFDELRIESENVVNQWTGTYDDRVKIIFFVLC